MPSPVALFVYARPLHAARTLRALQANAFADQTDLIVFSDGPRGPQDASAVAAVREVVRTARGFQSVTLVEHERNRGLAHNIIEGVTKVVEQHGRVIVVEDDLVTSPNFLRFMNNGLTCYEADDRVASIHGYCYPVRDLPETFFLRGADCWGWATWARAWKLFNPDGAALLKELKDRNLTRRFDLDGAMGYTAMLEAQIAGRNNSWAVRWHASAFLQEKLTLYPGRSLVHNIGNDQSGTHCGVTAQFDVVPAEAPVQVGGIPVEESALARQAFSDFFKQPQSRKAGRLRAAIKDWAPPALSRVARQLLPGRSTSFSGPFPTWSEAERNSTGYSQTHILEKVLAATRAVQTGAAAFERDSVLFDHPDYAWPVVSALMWSAARDGGSLRVLDFGGSLGSSYFQHRRFLKRLRNVKWGVVEQPHFVASGQQEIADENLQFFGSIDECAKAINPNVILLGSVLQYLPAPYSVLKDLAGTPACTLIIARTPYAASSSDTVLVQHVPPTIYPASYPFWLFSEQRLKLELGADWDLIGEETSGDGTYRQGDLTFSFHSMVLERSI
ncbi:methyltransferase, TIGR04325 family [Indioceanicola profundi]|uniref:methyltransferase, TIGR04325 family n=1 Tax=Indioceanicola profundi TaxID=2220096 RepID=UPI0013C4C9E3|nr:methyltransferase, TIGR04325 family [Indioceanicola profundi]